MFRYNFNLILPLGIIYNLTNFLDHILISEQINQVIILYDSTETSIDIVRAILSSQYSVNQHVWYIINLNKENMYDNKTLKKYDSFFKYLKYPLIISLSSGNILKNIVFLYKKKVISDSIKHLILMNSLTNKNITIELRSGNVYQLLQKKLNIVVIQWNTTIKIIRYRLYNFQLLIDDYQSAIFSKNNIYEEIFFDKSINLNGWDFSFLQINNPPRVILLKSLLTNSQYAESFGGNDAYLGLLIEKYFNVIVKYWDFSSYFQKNSNLNTDYLNNMVFKEYKVYDNLTIGKGLGQK